MRSPVRKVHPVMKLVNSALIDLPAPSNLSVWWNFGSLLGLLLGVQIITGLLLAAHYTASVEHAFSSVIHILRDVNSGWILNGIHANGASMVFLCLYFHVGRGLYYASYLNVESWTTGVVLLLMMMGTAFLGYVLPWGQMSFWGATVITNLLSSIPYVGTMLVQWIWGGFAVDNAALTRFYMLHFLFPFLISGLSVLHIIFLHETGSNNPLGINSDAEKVPFHAYYTFKDLVGFVVMLFGLVMLVMFYPQLLKDPENYIPANPLVTPVHIQPEWYFLFAYAILRSIPNKLGGVVGLAGSVLVLLIVPATAVQKFRSMSFYPPAQVLFWMFVGIFLILTWIGSCPVESPYEGIGQVFTVLYFLYFMMSPLSMNWWDAVLVK